MSEQIEASTIPSVEPFLKSDKFISLIMGPVGSTKTTAGIYKIMYHAAQMAPCKDGVRRSRAVWVRNTREQLRDTSIPDVQKWYPESVFGTFLKTEYRYIIRMGDIECDLLFRGLDDSNDVRRLLSLQASFAIFDEFREINRDIFYAMQGRLGRYPDKTMNGVGCVTEDGKPNAHLWGMSNPPDADTFWEEFISNPPENCSITIQPSGLSPEADWLHCLPDGYYDNLAEGKSEDWIDVYVHGKFGKSLQGRPVFRCFDKDQHVAKTPLVVQSSQLVIGVDAGLNPSAVITQQSYDGRLLVHDAITGNEGGMGALRFIREKLKPLLANKYRGQSVIVIIDPAAFQRAQTDERSVADIFKAEGFVVRPASTNAIAARLAAGENYMTRTVDGKPALLVSPDADLLIRALRSHYRYKMNTKGDVDDKPDKNHPWSDIADGFTYAALYCDAGNTFGGAKVSQKREIKPAPFRWAV